MKKIIGGKLHDESTAECIHEYETYSLTTSDVGYVDESLYITRQGRFFLAGSGWCDPWCDREGNAQSFGHDIITLDSDEALQWCEKRSVPVEITQKYFEIEEA